MCGANLVHLLSHVVPEGRRISHSTLFTVPIKFVQVPALMVLPQSHGKSSQGAHPLSRGNRPTPFKQEVSPGGPQSFLSPARYTPPNDPQSLFPLLILRH